MGFWEGLAEGVRESFGDVPDAGALARAVGPLALAGLLGGLVGMQRQRYGKPAGLRTHTLVALGTAAVLVAGRRAGLEAAGLGRLAQGLLSGVGFIGGGAILKRDDRVEGLTTAAGLWVAAAVGLAVGLSCAGVACALAALAWGVLEVLGRAEYRLGRSRNGDRGPNDHGPPRTAHPSES